jgi:hypothetical protein
MDMTKNTMGSVFDTVINVDTYRSFVIHAILIYDTVINIDTYWSIVYLVKHAEFVEFL